jgi:uncharacterized phage protein gp47/JayE
MILSLQNFTTLVRNMVSATQGACAQLLDLTVGSVLRATLEASASIGLWMQWLILLLLQTTRLATSYGADVDSWVGDFTLTRLPATAATGPVTFSRFTPTGAALVPVGAQVKTADGTQIFTVIADAANAAYSATLGGYQLAAGTASVNATVQAQNAGAQGNVQVGQISLIASAISGVDTVTNSTPFTNGVDAESDAALRARFVNFINTRSLATKQAIGYAISSVQQGLTWTIAENVLPDGTSQMGNFVVTVDDGSGAPSASLLSAVETAADAARPIGSTFSVQGPTIVTANISLTLTTSPASNKGSLVGPVANAIEAWVNALPIGAVLPYSRIAALAYGVDQTISDVTLVLVNGGTADIGGGPTQAVKVGTLAVN